MYSKDIDQSNKLIKLLTKLFNSSQYFRLQILLIVSSVSFHNRHVDYIRFPLLSLLNFLSVLFTNTNSWFRCRQHFLSPNFRHCSILNLGVQFLIIFLLVIIRLQIIFVVKFSNDVHLSSFSIPNPVQICFTICPFSFLLLFLLVSFLLSLSTFWVLIL